MLCQLSLIDTLLIQGLLCLKQLPLNEVNLSLELLHDLLELSHLSLHVIVLLHISLTCLHCVHHLEPVDFQLVHLI